MSVIITGLGKKNSFDAQLKKQKKTGMKPLLVPGKLFALIQSWPYNNVLPSNDKI